MLKFSSRYVFFKFCIVEKKLVTCIRNAKKIGVIDFVLEIKRAEKPPDFEKLAHLIHHALQGFIVKNIEGESTEANDLSHIL